MSNPNLTTCSTLSVSSNASVGGNLSTNGSVSCNSLSATGVVSCSGLNSLTTTNLNSLDTTSSVSMQFAQLTSDITTNNIAITNIQTKNAQQDDSLDALDGRMDTAESNLATIDITLLAHQAINDTQNTRLTTAEGRLTSAEGRLTTNEGNIASHSTSISSINSSISTINTKNNQQDSSISSLTSHQSTQDSSISSNSDSIYNLNVKATMMTYDSNCTTISRSGTNSTASFRVASDAGEQVLFIPKAVNNSFNKLIDQNDSAIVGAATVAIVPWNTNNNNGIRITQNDTTIAATTSDSVDNKIVLNANAKTIEFVSANYVVSNRGMVAPDFILSGTNDSVSENIGLLRAADTTETNNRTAADTTLTNNLATETQNRIDADGVLAGQYSWAYNAILQQVDSIGDLQNKTQKITYDATNHITKFDTATAISTSQIKYGNTATPQNLPVMRAWGLYRNDTGLSSGPANTLATLAITRINQGRYGVNFTGDAYTVGFLGYVQVQLISRGESGYGVIRGFTSYVKHVPVGSAYTYEVVVYGGGSDPGLADADFTICIF
jgi:predicted  nucleic acid-binding Zn-ribbon protein